MRWKAKFSLASMLAVAVVLGAGSQLRAGEPTEAIRLAVNQGVEILKGAKLQDKKQRGAIIDRLREIVYPLFDFREMAMRALGSYWRRISPQQQSQFVAVFTELLEKSYADKIDLYDGQRVVYAAESTDQNFAQVDTKILAKDGQTFSVVYKLHRMEGKWRIYDVVVENISLVNNYRSQFNRVIGNKSFEELIRVMKEKAE